jgi:DNA-binding NtrC family response regulator
VLMAEARCRVGHRAQALKLLDGCPENISPRVLARAYEVRAQLASEDGRPKDAVALLNGCIQAATEASDLRQTCRGQLALLRILLDQQGAQPCESVARDARRNVIRTGDPFLFELLHVRFAELEARTGNRARAFRHLEAGLKLLETNPNQWLLGHFWLTRSATEWVAGSMADGLRSARRARDAAKISGHENTRVAALCNIGYLSLWTGDLEQIETVYDELNASIPKGSVNWFSLMAAMVQRDMCRQDLAQCEHWLVACETELRLREHAPTSWPSIFVALGRIRLEASQGRCESAMATTMAMLPHVEKRGDPHLLVEWTLQRALLTAQIGDLNGARRLCDDCVALSDQTDIRRRGDIHWLRGQLFRAEGNNVGASRELGRAKRFWDELGGRDPYRTMPREDDQPDVSIGDVDADGQASRLATLLALGERPRLLGTEAAREIAMPSHAARVRVVAGPPGSRRVVMDASRDVGEVVRTPTSCIELGEQGGTPYQLQVYAANSPGAKSAIANVAFIVDSAVGLTRLRREEKYRGSLWPIEEGLMLEGNVFVAPRMREICTTARRVAPSDLPVLITGETGAGKEIIAREVHEASPRAGKAFGVLVCSGVPREMLDSHLFGHRRGAFTGAVDNFLGVIRANEGGTLLLDEIGEVSLDLQVKLLRFLETGEVHPLGETKPVKVDVRVIAATNQPLETLIKEGRFREDLFYRLNVVRLTLPPLRERREEILPFVERFLMRECARMGRPVPDLSDDAVEHLLLYTWPGNVRQLLNEVKRILATLPPGVEITPAVLSSDITAERQAAIAKAVAASPNQMLVRTDQSLQAAIDQVEKVMIEHALATSPDQETAAGKLDITRKGLFLKRQRLGIQ